MPNEDQPKGGLQKAGGLERIIGESIGIIDVDVTLVVNEFSRYVCQILRETAEGYSAIGTGFLVGPRHILTNFHVVEGVRTGSLFCRFDVRSDGPNRIKAGPLLPVEEQLAHSPYSAIESAGGYSSKSVRHPEPNELDYALLKIQDPGPEDNAEDKPDLPARGWLFLDEKQPAIHSESKVYVLQHPNRGTLQVAADKVADNQPSNGTRFRYLADTLNGSSGSPCFCWTEEDENKQSSLVLMALHNFGDPGSIFKKSEFNHGIPIHLIANDLRAKGVLDDLREAEGAAQQKAPDLAKKEGQPSGRFMEIDKKTSLAFIGAVALLVAGASYVWPDTPDASIEADAVATDEVLPVTMEIPYDPDFLGRVRVPLPTVTSANVRGDVLNGQVLDYIHYSLVMDERRAMPLYVAYNLDRDNYKSIRRDSDNWFLDERVPRDLQIGEGIYSRNDWDRGHLASRAALTWGSEEEASAAGYSAFSYTNSVPQMSTFNRQNWLRLELFARDGYQVDSSRVTVFAGPVHRQTDYEYRGSRIPRSFWKIIVADDPENPNNLFVSAFLMDQYTLVDESEVAAVPRISSFVPEAYQISISELETLIPLEFPVLERFEVDLSK